MARSNQDVYQQEMEREFGHPIGDHFLKAKSEGEKQLRLLMGICLSFGPITASHYVMNDDNSMTFFWSDPGKYRKNVIAFPFKATLETMLAFTLGFLMDADYGPEYDTDGSCHKGFLINSGDLISKKPYEIGPEGSFYAICTIKPEWIVCGK